MKRKPMTLSESALLIARTCEDAVHLLKPDDKIIRASAVFKDWSHKPEKEKGHGELWKVTVTMLIKNNVVIEWQRANFCITKCPYFGWVVSLKHPFSLCGCSTFATPEVLSFWEDGQLCLR